MRRYEINKKIYFRSLVPMKTLIFDLLNNEMFMLEYDYFQECKKILEEEIRTSIQEFQDYEDYITKKELSIKIMKELDVIYIYLHL